MQKTLRKILFATAIMAGTMTTANAGPQDKDAAQSKKAATSRALDFAIGFVLGAALWLTQSALRNARESKRFENSLRATLGDTFYDDENTNIAYFDTEDIQNGLDASETTIVVEDDRGHIRVGGILKREFFEEIAKNIMKNPREQNQR